MPEGDTVWRVARNLDRALSGATLTATDFRVPELATADLAGWEVGGTRSHGKHILMQLCPSPGVAGAADELVLHTHLKMEGAWHLYRPGGRWQRPGHEARVVLGTADWQAVGFALGIVELGPPALVAESVSHLGPDLLGPDWDPVEAVRRLSAQPQRSIGEALIDQSNLAGIGNLYRAELCFLFGVHPARPVAEVPDLMRLVTRGQQLLAANRERPEQATTGDLRRGRSHYVYRRNRLPCRRCGTTIRADELAGRAIYWCPQCQR